MVCLATTTPPLARWVAVCSFTRRLGTETHGIIEAQKAGAMAWLNITTDAKMSYQKIPRRDFRIGVGLAEKI